MTPQPGNWNLELIVAAAVGLIGLATILLFLGPVLGDIAALPFKKWTNWWSLGASGSSDVAQAVLGEPSVVGFFDALKAGPATPLPATHTVADSLQEFYDLAPRYLADLRKLFSEIGGAPTDEARQAKLLEAFHRTGTLRERAALPQLLPVWQVAFALEELLKQLQRKTSNVTPSVLRTSAAALDVLRELCNRRVRPDLVKAPPVRLLAVDDDPVCQRAISFALTKAFGEPDMAPGGGEALTLARMQAYDAIFLDVEMPEMNGFDLCSRIHETELNRTAPVVFVTRRDDLESRAQATLLGAQDFIAKPFQVFEITVKVLTIVLRQRLDSGASELVSAPESKATSAVPPAPVSETAPASGATKSPEAACLDAGASRTTPANSVLHESRNETRSVFPPLSAASACTDAAPVPEPKPGVPPAACRPVRQELADAFFVYAPTQIKALRRHLASATDARPGSLANILADLYLDAHRLCLAAQRAELNAALRLSSALETMTKKLFDRPKLCTPSTLDTAAGALDVLEQLCCARIDPDLAQPAARLLVVDDDSVACRAIAISLQLVFGRPDTADSGESALALAGKQEYDLIFLDVRMSRMDGFAACSRIHETIMNRFTSVVFVTGHTDTASRSQAAACGGCGFIPKPVLASQITLVALTFIIGGRLEQLKRKAAHPSLATQCCDNSRHVTPRQMIEQKGGSTRDVSLCAI